MKTPLLPRPGKILLLLRYTFASCLSMASAAFAELIITEFEIVDGQLRIVFEDTDGPSDDDYTLQYSRLLTEESWVNQPTAQFTVLDATHLQFTLSTVSIDRDFYRVLAPFVEVIVGTALDPDGDGLPDDLEAVIGTDPRKFDTDGDTFSDGEEFAFGTDPLLASSKPFLDTTLPTVTFELADSTTTEGSESAHLVKIVFDIPYNGPVNYAVNPLSNVDAGVDYTINESPNLATGSITLQGRTGFIPLTILDDAIVSGQRAVIIDLKLFSNPNDNYFIGGRASHIVLIEDNDSWWTGSLLPASGSIDGRIFRLEITSSSSGTSVNFGAGAGLDGLPVPVVQPVIGSPSIETTSISEAILPKGTWPATVVENSESRFSIEAPDMQISAGDLFEEELIIRSLSLNTQLSLNSEETPHLLQENRYIGEFIETLKSSNGTILLSSPGTFILVRDIPLPLPILSNLIPDAS